MKNITIFSLILVSFIACFTAYADLNTDAKKSLKEGLLQPATTRPLINETVEYKPIKGHHFNLEAPQECGDDSTIKPTAKTVTCQFHSAGNRKVVVSVCDDDKTYCKQEKVKTVVQQSVSTEPKIKKGPNLDTLKMQKAFKEKLLASFKVMTPDEAIQAVPMKKAALVMVSTDWCPPCNMAKEFMLQTTEFKEATKDLLLIYVDGDSPASDPWLKKLDTRYYPSFVVLNKKLDPISVFSDISSKDNIEKISLALEHLNDPINTLTARVSERASGGFFRKIKDFFSSDASILEDQKRQLEYLSAVGKYDELLRVTNNIEDKTSFANLERQAKFLTLEEKDNKFLESMLNMNPDDSPFYLYAMKEFCSKTKNEEDKTFSKECLAYKDVYLKSLETQEPAPEQEQKAFAAYNTKSKARLAEFFGEPELAKKLYAECAMEYEKLFAYTPLKKKSRTVRMEQVACLKDKNQDVALLKSLAEDYPFEATFHRKLAKHYSSKKDFKQALDQNQKAVDYSYGYMWIYNVSQRAEILEKLNRKKEALDLVESALSEVVLNKDDKRVNSALKSLRAKENSLRVL